MAYDQPVSLTLAPDVAETVLIDGIPTGTRCVFTEPSIPPQWALGGIASNEITIETTDIIEVNIVNVRAVGELSITKQIDGELDTDASFDLALDCDDDLFDTAVPIDVPAGSTSITESFSGIPTGVTCAVTESDRRRLGARVHRAGVRDGERAARDGRRQQSAGCGSPESVACSVDAARRRGASRHRRRRPDGGARGRPRAADDRAPACSSARRRRS